MPKRQAQVIRRAGRTRAGPDRIVPARPKRATRRGVKSKAALPGHVAEIITRLKREYPDAHTELDHRNAYELLVATILSAQCTDKRVNMVTPELFAEYPNPAALANAKPDQLEDMIRSTGFFRAKTRSLLGMANALVERYRGRVPDEMEDLTTLPGVGRKTANVVLGNAFGKNEGVVVDTHVRRLVVRLGITDETEPETIEELLMRIAPRDDWTIFSHLLIFHGRRVCVARLPKCPECVLNDICPSSRV